MISSGFSSVNFCMMAIQLGFVKCCYRKRTPEEQCLERAQLALPPVHRHRCDAFRIALQTGNIIEIPFTVGETKNVHLMLCREMADLVEGGDLVAPVRREPDTLADKEHSHQ